MPSHEQLFGPIKKWNKTIHLKKLGCSFVYNSIEHNGKIPVFLNISRLAEPFLKSKVLIWYFLLFIEIFSQILIFRFAGMLRNDWVLRNTGWESLQMFEAFWIEFRRFEKENKKSFTQVSISPLRINCYLHTHTHSLSHTHTIFLSQSLSLSQTHTYS